MAVRTGGCACGKVRFEIQAEPVVQGYCQCRECQRASGGGHSALVGVPRAAMTVTGTVKRWSRPTDSGGTFVKSFCPECGSPLWGEATAMPDANLVCIGSFDQPESFHPQFVLFQSSARSWDHIDPAVQRFPKMPG